MLFGFFGGFFFGGMVTFFFSCFVEQLDQEINRLERLLELSVESFPRLTEDLMYLLPESKVDETPAFQRRRRKELERCAILVTWANSFAKNRKRYKTA